jgi:hypothetical protein
MNQRVIMVRGALPAARADYGIYTVGKRLSHKFTIRVCPNAARNFA